MNERQARGPVPVDPHPRVYPTLVTLIRRAARGADAAPRATTCEEIRRWLLSGALADDDLLPLSEALVWRMVAAGLPVDRMTIHAGTLHPQLLGYYWYWDRRDGLVDALKVDQAGIDTDRYRRSPLAKVIEEGETFRARTDDPALADQYPLLADLAADGIREYTIVPLGAGKSYHNAVTLGTRRGSGFSEVELRECGRIFEIFALHVQRQIAWGIAENVLDTYLGGTAGHLVLNGAIRRGAGESIRAVVWMSDLRGFASLADRLPGNQVLAILNAYFERLAGTVIAQGGEVLKFIGDGLLAVFPILDGDDGRAAAAASLQAAQQALAALEQLNNHAPESLRGIDGWRPLHSGIALHLGEVFFGNVGAPERLDFTVIGRAVNEASRVEALTKELGHPIIVTEPVARLLECTLENIGSHHLRGLAAELTLYSLPTGG